MLSDFKFALRTLAKTPGFTAAAVTVLALGIGANTAVFSLVHALPLRPADLRPPGRDRAGVFAGQEKPEDLPRLLLSDLPRHPRAEPGLHRHARLQPRDGRASAKRKTPAGRSPPSSAPITFRVLRRPARSAAAPSCRGGNPGRAMPPSSSSATISGRSAASIPRSSARRCPSTAVRSPWSASCRRVSPGTMNLFSSELWLPLGVYDQVANDFAEENRTSARQPHRHPAADRRPPEARRSRAATAEPALKTLAANLESAFPVEQKDQTFLVRPPLPLLDQRPAPARKAMSPCSAAAARHGRRRAAGRLPQSRQHAARPRHRAPEGNRHPPRPRRRPRPHRPPAAHRGFRALPARRHRRPHSRACGPPTCSSARSAAWCRWIWSSTPVRIPALLAATFGFCVLGTIAFGLGPGAQAVPRRRADRSQGTRRRGHRPPPLALAPAPSARGRPDRPLARAAHRRHALHLAAPARPRPSTPACKTGPGFRPRGRRVAWAAAIPAGPRALPRRRERLAGAARCRKRQHFVHGALRHDRAVPLGPARGCPPGGRTPSPPPPPRGWPSTPTSTASAPTTSRPWACPSSAAGRSPPPRPAARRPGRRDH